jgi:hypothetical protein
MRLFEKNEPFRSAASSLVLLFGIAALPSTTFSQDPGKVEKAEKAPVLQRKKFDKAAFLTWMKAHGAKPLLLQKFEKEWAVGPDSRITDRVLRKVIPAYRKAMNEVDAGMPRGVLDLTKLLLKTKDPYLRAHSRYFLARALLDEDDPEGAVLVLADFVTMDSGFSLLDGEGAFYIGYSLALIPDAGQAILNLKAFLQLYPDSPERYRANAAQLLAELEAQWDSPLHAIADEMKYCERKLKKEQTGKKVETKQLGIVEKLTKLIEQLEKEEQKQGGGPPKGNQQSKGPANQSSLSDGPGRVGQLHGSRGVKSKWGEVKDRERKKIMNEIQTKLPERYRGVLERYYRKVNRGGK